MNHELEDVLNSWDKKLCFCSTSRVMRKQWQTLGVSGPNSGVYFELN